MASFTILFTVTYHPFLLVIYTNNFKIKYYIDIVYIYSYYVKQLFSLFFISPLMHKEQLIGVAKLNNTSTCLPWNLTSNHILTPCPLMLTLYMCLDYRTVKRKSSNACGILVSNMVASSLSSAWATSYTSSEGYKKTGSICKWSIKLSEKQTFLFSQELLNHTIYGQFVSTSLQQPSSKNEEIVSIVYEYLNNAIYEFYNQ